MADAVSAPNYYNLSALDWGLTAGNYTLNLIPTDGFDGGLYVGAPGTPDTLLANHYSIDGGSNWSPDSTFIYGLQIFGTEIIAPPPDPDSPPPDTDTGLLTELSRLLGAIVSSVVPPDITAVAGAINLASLNGSIDISGTTVRITGLAGEVAARADAIGSSTTNATAIALNGTQLATTAIGAMNSATLDTLGKTVEQMATVTTSLGVVRFAGNGAAAFALPAVSTTDTGTDITMPLPSVEAFSALTTGASTAVSLQGLHASLETTSSALVEQLQPTSAFNMALNAAPVAAGVRMAATVDTAAWFLNPQTGVVDLANLQITTTAIGAMNSGLTHLGQRLASLGR